MARRTGNYQIPFTENGDMTRSIWNTRTVELRDNFEFTDTLNFMWMNSKQAMFTRVSDGTRVSFFLNELERLIPFMISGNVTGLFTFTKRGQFYSCKLIMLQ